MKDDLFLDICKENYFALIQMIEQAIDLCPDKLWSDDSHQPQFWQEIYHTIYYLDFYLGTSPRKHIERFDCKENLGEKPVSILTKPEMQSYLREVKEKCQNLFADLTAQEIEGKNSYWWTGPTLGHRLIYNIRHSQHHMGKINLILKQNGFEASKWVIKVKQEKKS